MVVEKKVYKINILEEKQSASSFELDQYSRTSPYGSDNYSMLF